MNYKASELSTSLLQSELRTLQRARSGYWIASIQFNGEMWPEEQMRVGRLFASAPRLAEQIRILREALVGLCDSQLSSRDRESAIANGLSALEATKEGT